MIKKNLYLIPFLIIVIFTAYSLVVFFTTSYVITPKHWVACLLIALNAVIYFFNRRVAVLLTAIILLLATMNLIAFTVSISTISLGIAGISTPDFQWIPLLLLIFFIIVYQRFIFTWILDYQDKKKSK